MAHFLKNTSLNAMREPMLWVNSHDPSFTDISVDQILITLIDWTE